MPGLDASQSDERQSATTGYRWREGRALEERRLLLRDEAATGLVDGCEPREAMALEALTPVFEKAVVEFGHGTTMAAAMH